METRQVILQLRTAKGLSQEELAEKVYVTRQAVSRWETGETVPNTETLKPVSYTHLTLPTSDLVYCCPSCLMSPSTPCWAARAPWSASAAVCRWMIPP